MHLERKPGEKEVFKTYKIKKQDNGYAMVSDPSGELCLKRDVEEAFNEFQEKETTIKRLEEELAEASKILRNSRQSNIDKISQMQDQYEEKIKNLEQTIQEKETEIEKSKEEEFKNKEYEEIKSSIQKIKKELHEKKKFIKTEESKNIRKEISEKILHGFKFLKTGDKDGDISELFDDSFIIEFSQKTSEVISEKQIEEIDYLIRKL